MNNYRLRIEIRRAYTLAHIIGYIVQSMSEAEGRGEEESHAAIVNRIWDLLFEWREEMIRHFKHCRVEVEFPVWDRT